MDNAPSAAAAIAATLLGSPSRVPARDVMNGALSAAEAELKIYLLQTIERFNRHEMRPPESPGFSPDADFVNVQGRWMKGVDEIRRGQKEEGVTRLKDAQITLLELDIRFIRPEPRCRLSGSYPRGSWSKSRANG